MTEYIILREDQDAPLDRTVWREVDELGIVKASSTRRALADIKTQGTYVAVPVRSWKPLKVKLEQTTKVTIG